MSTRYLTGATLAILGGFVVVASQAFTASAITWIAFGVAVAVASISLLAQLDRFQGIAQRTLDAAILAVAGLMMAFALAASGQAVIWLSFAFALGVVGLAFGGLTLHEVSNWRAAHNLGQLRWLPQQRSAVMPVERRDARAA